MAAPKLHDEAHDDKLKPDHIVGQWESASSVKKKPLRWFLPGRIPAGTLTILEGEKGVSKSTLACAIASAVSRGSNFMGRKKASPSNVLWLPGEEDVASVVRPRLEVFGADLKRVHFPITNDRGERKRVLLPSCMNYLREAVAHFQPSLLIIDPLSSHIDPEISLKDEQPTHSVLDPLADLAHASGCVILLTRNLTKNRSAARIDRGLGGATVGGVARSVLVIDWPDRRLSRRVLRVVVCNIAGQRPPMEFHLSDVRGWPVLSDVKELPADQADDDDGDIDPGERDVREDARILLKRLIAEDWVSVSAIEAEASIASIGSRTLRNAKADLKVRSRRNGSTTPARWEWGPPKQGW